MPSLLAREGSLARLPERSTRAQAGTAKPVKWLPGATRVSPRTPEFRSLNAHMGFIANSYVVLFQGTSGTLLLQPTSTSQSRAWQCVHCTATSNHQAARLHVALGRVWRGRRCLFGQGELKEAWQLAGGHAAVAERTLIDGNFRKTSCLRRSLRQGPWACRRALNPRFPVRVVAEVLTPGGGGYSTQRPVFSARSGSSFTPLPLLYERYGPSRACGLFPQALEEVQACLRPGLLPPVSVLHSCMLHALQGDAQPYFLATLSSVLTEVLRNNPTWDRTERVAYFLQVLQCPRCGTSAWALFQTSVRICLANADTCHPLPSPAPPELLRFHGDLQAFFLRLFQLELRAAVSRGRTGGSRASVLRAALWSVWERSTLTSKALLQLTELLVEASIWALHSNQEWRLRVLATLQEILAVAVEFWSQENSQLNGRLVEKGFQDLAEHMAILCQDLPLDCLRELVPALSSSRLRMFTADAVYRNISCRKGLLLRPEPLSLLKIVSSYLKALGHLCGFKPKHSPQTRPERSSITGSGSQVSGSEERQHVGVSSFGKENLPRGFHRVNPAGETLLHRACRRNQVDTVLKIISVPGTDVNVKDHAGWTPLHEACNHGSTECVRVLLQLCPDLELHSQVEGVSPLHDALLNQHTHIAKMLLRHAGSALLRVRDHVNRTPLDLVTSTELFEELQACAGEGDGRGAVEVQDLNLVEACSCLLSSLLLTYLQEHHILSYDGPDPPLDLGPSEARALLRLSPGAVASLWGDFRAVSLAEDLRTLMNLELYVRQASPALQLCQGPHTSLFLLLLRDLRDEWTALLSMNRARNQAAFLTVRVDDDDEDRC
ncbi:SMC5-SMC6 complex localization factor protein 1 [Brachyhypopomus gauderio]|uniref:SMC5-SMC6 complex localization factor protein 1 n=1 Tax=Brachyhypopomus gauderio TaxID=698409 RepID=UPI0040431A8C